MQMQIVTACITNLLLWIVWVMNGLYIVIAGHELAL